jgi:hypothetical protein
LPTGFYQAKRAQQPTGAAGSFSVDTQVLFSNVPADGAANQIIHINAPVSTMLSVSTGNTATWLQISPFGVINVTAGSPNR